MLVRELINELKDLDEDTEIVIEGANSGGYVDSIGYGISDMTHEIRTFYGDNIEAYVILADEQIGMY